MEGGREGRWLYSTLLYCTVLYCIALYCTVLYFIVNCVNFQNYITLSYRLSAVWIWRSKRCRIPGFLSGGQDCKFVEIQSPLYKEAKSRLIEAGIVGRRTTWPSWGHLIVIKLYCIFGIINSLWFYRSQKTGIYWERWRQQARYWRM